MASMMASAASSSAASLVASGELTSVLSAKRMVRMDSLCRDESSSTASLVAPLRPLLSLSAKRMVCLGTAVFAVLLCVCLAAVGELVCLWGAGQSGVLVGFGCLGALGGLVCLRGTGESSSELSERLMGYHCTDDVDILGCTRGS
jgi:hypothetical protein